MKNIFDLMWLLILCGKTTTFHACHWNLHPESCRSAKENGIRKKTCFLSLLTGSAVFLSCSFSLSSGSRIVEQRSLAVASSLQTSVTPSTTVHTNATEFGVRECSIWRSQRWRGLPTRPSYSVLVKIQYNVILDENVQTRTSTRKKYIVRYTPPPINLH